MYSMLFFFFFKQKTAYEMRISDWSSDVCSSDLDRRWQDIRASGGDTFEWPNDNYMKEQPFFLEVGPELPATEDIVGARPLVLLADSKIGRASCRERVCQ